MNAKNGYILKLLCLLVMFGQNTAHAAAPFDPDVQPIGYVGQPDVSNNILAPGSSERIFAIDYNNLFWSGNVRSYPLTDTGAITDADDWNSGAAAEINGQNFATGRRIVTTKGNMTLPLLSVDKIPFLWGSITATQKGALDPATSIAAVSSPVLNFVRGDRSNERPNGAQYRSRFSVLGDIIHSTPVYWDDGTNKTVFVGANDGMLHALDDNGRERFAYIPSVLISKLSTLRADPYIHKYFVDGRMDIRSFTISGIPKSILVGALGSGGRGLFALDVTTTSATTEAGYAEKILWEVSNSTTGYANLGHTYGLPVLATLPNGTPAVIVGNGYNNTGNGRASLFVIDANTGAKIAEIDTGSGTSGSPNGLSSPMLLDVNIDGRADFAYAGDIDGNLWKFDLSTNTRTLLYTTSPAQAITMAPGVTAHPEGGYMVTFVTGRMFTTADTTDTATHSAYGIWDIPSTHPAFGVNTGILAQTLTEATYGVSPSIRVRTASTSTPNWSAGNHRGWKTPLPIGGERVVGDGAFVTSSVFVFLSSNPTVSPTATPPGENWEMQLNAITGGGNGTIRFDLNGDRLLTVLDQVSGAKPVGRHIGGGVRSQFIRLATPSGEILQASVDLNGSPPVPPSVTERGVSGGHFDFDIFHPSCGALQTSTVLSVSYTYLRRCVHKHEYDDTYDVTGVNMLNASLTSFNLSNAITSTTTRFKVLVSNQAYNPAARLSVGVPGAPGSVVDQSVFSYGVTPSLTVASLPTYTRADVDAADPTRKFTLTFSLPLDAFASRDWGTGVVRAGLHPTQTSCMNGNPPRFNGPENAWRNGSLTIQIIKDTTPDSAIELNVAARPDLGYRVKPNAAAMANLLAEYATFWHHPNGRCYGDGGWVPNPPQDTAVSDASVTPPAAGSTDPRDGTFGAGTGGGTATAGSVGTGSFGVSVGGVVGAGVSGGGTGVTTVLPPVVVVTPNIDGTTTTTTTTISTTVTADTSTTETTTRIVIKTAANVTISDTERVSTRTINFLTNVGNECTVVTNRLTSAILSDTCVDLAGLLTESDRLGRVNWRELLQ